LGINNGYIGKSGNSSLYVMGYDRKLTLQTIFVSRKEK